MPEVAKLLVASKLINKVAKCAFIHESLPHLGQIYLFKYNGKIMLGAQNGYAFGMRIAVYDETDLTGQERLDADEQYEQARRDMGLDTWMFPADLKIPNGLNVTIILYDDHSTIFKTKNAVYGPFEQILMLDGAEFNVFRIFKYPEGGMEGSSRAVNPVLLTKLIAAICVKDDTLIMNTHGRFDQPLHFMTTEGTAYGMLMPIRDPGLAEMDGGDPGLSTPAAPESPLEDDDEEDEV
jgi:hypothetical protein